MKTHQFYVYNNIIKWNQKYIRIYDLNVSTLSSTLVSNMRIQIKYDETNINSF